jgi:hypothetical protein
MTSRNLTNRLERLETRLAPSGQLVLKIEVTHVGGCPAKIIELQLHPTDRRRGCKGQETTGRL